MSLITANPLKYTVFGETVVSEMAGKAHILTVSLPRGNTFVRSFLRCADHHFLHFQQTRKSFILINVLFQINSRNKPCKQQVHKEMNIYQQDFAVLSASKVLSS